MAGGGAKVQSEAIAEFEAALGRFAQASIERVAAAETAIRRTSETLEDRRGELRRELSRLQDEIANADEDEDTSHVKRRYEETEDALANVRRWQQTVTGQMESYKREALRLEELSAGTTAEARAFLRRLLDDLSAYYALQTQGTAVGVNIGGESSASGVVSPSSINQPFDPTSFSLPKGFRWVPISEIDTARDLADVSNKESFRKVSYDEMLHGFETLRSEILPAINDPANPANKDTFRRRDEDEMVPYEKGTLRVYEAFFGDDVIHLDRGQNDKLFGVDSGRHRIRVAMDAGWTAVPVRITDIRE